MQTPKENTDGGRGVDDDVACKITRRRGWGVRGGRREGGEGEMEVEGWYGMTESGQKRL